MRPQGYDSTHRPRCHRDTKRGCNLLTELAKPMDWIIRLVGFDAILLIDGANARVITTGVELMKMLVNPAAMLRFSVNNSAKY